MKSPAPLKVQLSHCGRSHRDRKRAACYRYTFPYQERFLRGTGDSERNKRLRPSARPHTHTRAAIHRLDACETGETAGGGRGGKQENCCRDPGRQAAARGKPASLTCRPPPLRRGQPVPVCPCVCVSPPSPDNAGQGQSAVRPPPPPEGRRLPKRGKRGEPGESERGSPAPPPRRSQGERPNRPLPTSGLRGARRGPQPLAPPARPPARPRA